MRSEYSRIRHADTREIPFWNNNRGWNIIIECSNTLHTSSNSDGAGWNASRNHIPSWMRCYYKTSGAYLELSEEFSVSANSYLRVVSAKKQSTCYTKRFNVRAQKPQVTQCILTRNIVHWITLEKVPLIFSCCHTRARKNLS